MFGSFSFHGRFSMLSASVIGNGVDQKQVVVGKRARSSAPTLLYEDLIVLREPVGTRDLPPPSSYYGNKHNSARVTTRVVPDNGSRNSVTSQCGQQKGGASPLRAHQRDPNPLRV